ncbi:MAG: hypothetical protein ABIP51_15340 [Bacteroidia bacterium]
MYIPITFMSKLLSEIDNVYGSMFQKMTKRERISYCALLINKYSSEKNRDKERASEILVAAQNELDLLTDQT